MYEDEIYGGYDDGQVQEIKGITDTVTDLPFTNLAYPAIVFKDGVKLPRHRAQAISNMVKSSAGSCRKDITLYFQNEGELFKMGTLAGIQLSSLLEIVPRDQLLAYYTDGSLLEGSKIYALCSFL